MSMSNEQIFDRLKQLGCNSPTINENNRMHGLALIYNSELELNSDVDDMVSDDQDMEQKLLCKEQRLVSPNTTCQVNWNDYMEMTKQDIQYGLRYAITQWEGEQDEVRVQFKRMRLSEDPQNDERVLQTQFVLDDIVQQICFTENKYIDYGEIDDYELAALSEKYEKEYYGYLSDNELILAMNRLFPEEEPMSPNLSTNSTETTSIMESPSSTEDMELQKSIEDNDEFN
ncbi:unnamed protein product [Rotaria magnacalcarata]|uniref:Uncharacterized protein n=1 Tax=Rotaria magnacalcarata TaxID=392030 RepID=A0A815JEE7_9BILA|nr:unnamed protein product [Rotaria magnacalcarata]